MNHNHKTLQHRLPILCDCAILRTELMTKMFPEESSGAKDCDSEIAVGLATARTTLVESAFGDSRHKQVRLVISRRSGSAIGRCKGPSRRTGSDRSSLGETSGGSGSSQHDDYRGFSNSELSSLK